MVMTSLFVAAFCSAMVVMRCFVRVATSGEKEHHGEGSSRRTNSTASANAGDGNNDGATDENLGNSVTEQEMTKTNYMTVGAPKTKRKAGAISGDAGGVPRYEYPLQRCMYTTAS